MPIRRVQIALLSAVVAAQTLLIGLDSQRIASVLSEAAQCFVLAQGGDQRWSWAAAGLFRWALGLLPLVLALAVGGVAAWALRVFSATPAQIAGLGTPVGLLSLMQAAVLALWFWLLPPQPPDSDWHNDGQAYTVIVVLSAAAWMFCNPLLLWRCAGGRTPPRDPEELRRLYRLAREHREARDRAEAARRESQTPPG